MYVHFTSEQDAHAIVASGELRHDRYHLAPTAYAPEGTGVVYGCEVGVTQFVPEVQTTGNTGRLACASLRTHAVLFEAALPDERSPFEEEVLWYANAPPLADACVVTADEAAELLRRAYTRPRYGRDRWGEMVPLYGDMVRVA